MCLKTGSARRFVSALAGAFVFCAVLCGGLTATADAKDTVLGLNSNAYYDIYLTGNDSECSVVRNIMVVEVRTYFGQDFLVVQPNIISLGDSQGLILLKNIQAILPSNKIQSMPAQRKTIYQK